jgi:hypothetical protein
MRWCLEEIIAEVPPFRRKVKRSLNYLLRCCAVPQGAQTSLPGARPVSVYVVGTGKKEAIMETHQCSAGTQWTLNRENYPKVNLLCGTCGKELRSIYLDDLEGEDLEFFARVLKLHKKHRKEKYGEDAEPGDE